MPFEVNEIGIRLQVRDRGEEPGEERPRREETGCGELDHDEIVEECVRRVLRILKEARER